MKKVIYSILGCAALLTVGTATGREALAGLASQVMQRAEGDTYVVVNSVNYLEATYDAAEDKVKISFEAPQQATSMPSWDEYEFTTIDKICVYRNDGYYDMDTRVLVHEFTDVAKGQPLTCEEAAPAHGKEYRYTVIASIGDHEGSPSSDLVLVGMTIDQATEFTVTPGEKGAKKVTLHLVVPTTANEGAVQITDKIAKVEFTRKPDYSYSEGDVIATFEDVDPGQVIDYVDEDEALELGTSYTYTPYFTYDGQRKSYWQNNETVLVGPDKPGPVEEVTAALQPDGLSVKVSWTPFDGTGVKSGWVDPETLCYNVYRYVAANYSRELLAEGITETEIIDNGITQEGQYSYIVYTCVRTAEGVDESRSCYSNDVVAGPPSAMPFLESWPETHAQHTSWELSKCWSTVSQLNCSYYDADGKYQSVQFESGDGDGGMMGCRPYSYSSEVGDVETLVSGRISMKDAINPILKFKYLDQDPSRNDNIFKVYVAADGGEYKQLESVDVETLPGLDQWVDSTASLAEYVETCEYIRLKFEVTVGSLFGKTAIDKVEVRELKPVDLVVNSVTVPKTFYPGATFNVAVSVSNTGDNFSEPFAAMVTIDGQGLGYAESAGLDGFSSGALVIPVKIDDAVEGGNHDIAVELVGGYEATTDNNVGSAQVEVLELPAVAEFRHADLVLSWDAVGELPFCDSSKDVAEDFLAYEYLTNESFGDWTVIDGDNQSTYTFPAENFPLNEEKTGGLIFNPTEAQASFTPAVGDKCFLFLSSTGLSDDWLISPELNGLEQTVTFQALTTNDYDDESFEVMASSTDKDRASFVSVVKFEKIKHKNEWKQYTATLPAGTKYFAIHYYSNYRSGVAIDDVHFSTGSGLTSPETVHIGYNVYCDAAKVNDEVITDTQYALPEGAPSGDYTVKAVYNNAESKPSASLYISTVGVEGVAASAVGVSVEGSEVVISGEGAFAIADVAGRTVAKGNGNARVALPAGTYIVATTTATVKVAVK